MDIVIVMRRVCCWEDLGCLKLSEKLVRVFGHPSRSVAFFDTVQTMQARACE